MRIDDCLYIYIWNGLVNNCNTFVVNGEVPLIIDPGHRRFLPELKEGLNKDGIDIDEMSLVINTHSHPDHSEADIDLLESHRIRLAMHHEEHRFIRSFGQHLTRILGIQLPSFKPDFFLREGELVLGLNKCISLKVIHTPGHSPGSICIYWEERKVLFAGDLIFNRGVGRTDLPGGNGAQLKESIERVSSLEVEYLLPGHGDIIRGPEEIHRNFEFIRDAYYAYI